MAAKGLLVRLAGAPESYRIAQEAADAPKGS
jgi:hypothetical protein